MLVPGTVCCLSVSQKLSFPKSHFSISHFQKSHRTSFGNPFPKTFPDLFRNSIPKIFRTAFPKSHFPISRNFLEPLPKVSLDLFPESSQKGRFPIPQFGKDHFPGSFLETVFRGFPDFFREYLFFGSFGVVFWEGFLFGNVICLM